MSVDRASKRGWQLTVGGLRASASRAPGKFFPPSQLRKLRGTEQVAAVCYRVSARGIEFLLVQTRGGRWTFPKGSSEPGLTYAQAAALEAYEEAGVHGRIEESSFARYVRRGRRSGERDVEKALAVHAHLCEVTRLGPPQEARRHPTWFSAEKAKSRLRADRAAGDGEELARVVDRAVSRVERLCSLAAAPVDPLHKVQFEPGERPVRMGEIMQVSGASFTRYIRRQDGERPQSAPVELAVNAQLSKLLRFSPLRGIQGGPLLLSAEKGLKALGTGKKGRRT